MQRTDYARLVRKGGYDAPRVSHGAHAGYSFRAAVESDGDLCHGAYVGYSADFAKVSLLARFIGCKGGFDIGADGGDSNEVGLELRVHKYIDLPGVTLSFGLGAGPSWIRQFFVGETIPGEPQLGVFPTERTGLALHGDLTFGLRRDIARGFYAGIEGAAMVYLLRREQGNASSSLESTFVPRFGFSIGKQF